MKKQCYGCFENYDETLDMCPHCGYEEGDGPEEASHLEPGRILKETYIIGRVLGYGGFGVTYLGWNTVLEQKVAIKEYLPSEFSSRMPGQTKVTVFNGDKSEQFHDGVEKFVEEANRLAQFRNTDGIVRIFESFHENNTAYIIMEYLDGQTLTEYLTSEDRGEKNLPPKHLSADEAVGLMTPIIQSLQIVHEQGIIHRDIAPDNIMITKDGQVKLIDFGAARYATTSHSRSLTVVIKPGYSPEEQYRSRGDQGPWTDVYAVGATMYRMITGQTPPDAMERRAFFEGKQKDVLESIGKYSKRINTNQETAILNAMNVRIEDRTPDMRTFEQEMTSEDAVKRRYGRIKKIDILKWPLWIKIAIPAAACFVIVLSTLFAFGVIGFKANLEERAKLPDGYARVPSIVNNDEETAKGRAEAAGLFFQIEDKKHSDDIPENLVYKQNLGAGSLVQENTPIYVIMSAGKAKSDEEVRETDDKGQLELIDVTSMNKEDAIRELERQRLKIKIEEKPDKTTIAGRVISQNPVGKTRVDPGSVITIVVSTGSEDFAFNMPDVVGKTEASARAELNENRLVVNVDYSKNDGIPIGNVISQNPTSGSKVNIGDKATITVSSGKPLVTVPNVIGKQKNAAGNDLKGLGLEVEVSGAVSDRPKDEIISQTPDAGTNLEKGGKVIITFSKGQCTVTLDAQGGSVSPASLQANIGGTVGNLPKATRSNYSFVGWFTEKSGGSQVTYSTIINGDMRLYARWTQDVYTVNYDPNGGNVSTTSQQVPSGQGISLPTPSRQHFIFQGWFTSREGGTKVENGQPVNGNMTLFAHWVQTQYTVTFDPNGGSVSPTTRKVDAGKAIGSLPTPTKDYHTFTSWKNGSTSVNTSFVVNGNITLVAEYEENALSGWTLADSVPAGAKIVNTKWTYTLRDWKTSSSSSYSGYTRDDTKTTYTIDWNGTVNWFDSPQTTSETYRHSGNRSAGQETYLYFFSNGSTFNLKKLDSSYYEVGYWVPTPDVYWYSPWYHPTTNPVDAYTTDYLRYQVTDYPMNKDETRPKTQYGYQSGTKIYTYHFYKDTNETTTAGDPTGKANVTNVVKWIQYRAK